MAQFSAKTYSDLLNKKDQQNLYEILGCDELNSKEQINTEFKKKALQHHPDKNRNKEDGEVDESHQIFERYSEIYSESNVAYYFRCLISLFIVFG
jgi:DnaJ-class molecular chaperone